MDSTLLVGILSLVMAITTLLYDIWRNNRK